MLQLGHHHDGVQCVDAADLLGASTEMWRTHMELA